MSMNYLAILASLLLAASVQAGGLSAQRATDHCSRAADHSLQRACLIREASKFDAALTAAQAVVRKRILAWEEDADYKARSLKLFTATGRQFKQYKSSRCEFEASTAAGGNGAGDMRLSCQIELDGAYLQALQTQAGWF